MNRDSLVFYISQYEAVKELNNEQLGTLYRAIFETALGNEPEIPHDIKIAYNFIQNQVKVDAAKYDEKIRKCSESGKLGGAPKGNKNASKTNKTSKNKQTVDSLVSNKQNKLNVNVNENVNVNVNVNEAETAEETHDILTLGALENVFLTPEEHKKLKATYTNTNKLIDKVSAWLPNAKTDQHDHYALCIKFAQNDDWPKKPKEEPPEPEAPKDLLSPEEQREAVRIMRETLNNSL